MCATGPTSKLTEMNELLKDPTYNRMGSNIALFPVAGINVVRFDCKCCGLQPPHYQCIGWIIAFDTMCCPVQFWFSWRYQLKEMQKEYHAVAVDMRLVCCEGMYSWVLRSQHSRWYGMVCT